jgi:sulfur carrier protein
VREDRQHPHGTGRWAAGAATRDNAAMDIRLNGDALALPAPCTIAELLAAQGLAERRVAVEVNGEIVPRGRHADHVIADGDVVEIVHALGGG